MTYVAIICTMDKYINKSSSRHMMLEMISPIKFWMFHNNALTVFQIQWQLVFAIDLVLLLETGYCNEIYNKLIPYWFTRENAQNILSDLIKLLHAIHHVYLAPCTYSASVVGLGTINVTATSPYSSVNPEMFAVHLMSCNCIFIQNYQHKRTQI